VSLIYTIGRQLFRFFFRSYFRWQVFYPDRVPQKGRAILAANHASFLDPPLVGSAAKREISYLARETLFRFPGIGWLLRKVNAVPIDREGGGPAGLKTILDRLSKEEAIVLFPEGTRTRDGQLQKARSGIGLIVIKSGAPVIPIRIWGTYEAYSRKHKVPLPRPVTIKFGKPIYFTELRIEAESASKARLKEIYQEIADCIMLEIAALEPNEEGSGNL
jgi:1-acyl-sn-glycerol-3-phosphate acyltransferase